MRHSAYQCAPPGGSESGPRGATPRNRRSGSRTSKSGRRSSSSAPRPWKSTKTPSGSAAAGRTRSASSGGVAANLPVRDDDARRADEHHPRDAEQAEPPIRRVPAPEAREDERAEDPADEAADMAAPRDPAEREAEDQVDDDQAERLAADDLTGREVLEHEQRAEEAEDRARRADGQDERRLEKRARGAGEQRHEVEEEVAPAAEHLLERRADEPPDAHVQADVEEVRVQEAGRDEAPPVAVRDVGAVEREPVDDAAAAPRRGRAR